jgi:ABC-2 type transport system permease protein
MKNIWLLTKTNIKRNKLAVFLAILGAGMLCMILWSVGGMIADKTLANIAVGVIDHDRSALSQDFKDYLKENLQYDLLENDNFDSLSSELVDKNISIILEIPENFYEQYASGNKENVIITSLDDYENAAFVQVYINNYLSGIHILAKAAAGDAKSFDRLLTGYDETQISISNAAAKDIDKEALASQIGFINSVGFYLMFIFSISVILSFMVLDDRLSGVYNRIQATPVKPVQYIVGSGVFGLFLCIVQMAIFCGYIKLLDIDTGIPIDVIVFLMILFSVFTVCFSLAIAVVLKSKNAMASIVIGFSTVGCILGGAYFPLDMAPKTLQNLARILPQYWFMDAFRSLQSDITANIYPNITILVLFSILSLLIGAVLFSQNYKNN